MYCPFRVPRDQPRYPCSMQSSRIIGMMNSPAIEQTLSLWESNICDTQAPLFQQNLWREHETTTGHGSRCLGTLQIQVRHDFPSAYWRTAPNLCCIFPSLKELDMRFIAFGSGMATAISQQIESLGKTMDVTWHATMWELFSWLDSFERSLSWPVSLSFYWT
jgi:hypothetical protein